jgi:hypothetical protein
MDSGSEAGYFWYLVGGDACPGRSQWHVKCSPADYSWVFRTGVRQVVIGIIITQWTWIVVYDFAFLVRQVVLTPSWECLINTPFGV